MGKQSSVFLTLAILATIAAGIGFFLFYQKQQETLQLDEKTQRLTSRIGEFEEKLKQAETTAREAQVKQQQLERKMQTAPADNDKIAALEQELTRATDALDALKAQQSADTTTREQAKTLQDTIADQQQQIDGLTAQLQEQQQTAATKDAALAEQQKQVETLTAQLQEQQQVATLPAENADLKTQTATRAIPTPETTPTEEQPVATPAASDEQQAERDTLLATLQEKEAKIDELMQQVTEKQTRLSELETQLAEQQTASPDQSSEQLAMLQKENQEYQTQLTALQQQNQEQLAALQEAQRKAAALEADAQTQEEEYRKLKEAHDQSLASLQAEIANENIEKETIQTRLREELDRSNTEYQTRLDSLAQKKEEEIQQLKSMAETYQNLTRDLEKEIEDKTVRIEQIEEKLRVVIVNQILFDSGSAQVSKEGVKVLKTIGGELKRNLEGRQIGIEGHTDNETIGKRLQKQYATNWELSSARASTVLRYLQETLKIPGAKLFAVGYGSHHPVADNATEEGRRLNRRIEIILSPELERSKK